MAINVLIVDDSTFICKRVREILEQPLPTGKQPFKVVGEAHNGLEAVRLAQALEPDVITMDIEMPLLDGISAVKRIMQTAPTPILMFSAMTQVGAQATLDALEAGAVDFLPKRLDDIDADRETAKKLLRRRVGTVALEAGRIKNRPRPAPAAAGEVKTARHVVATAAAPSVRPRLIVIAASTGGPVAVQRVLTKIPAACPVPILVLQHMPVNFTRSFAERLDRLCQVRVNEAQEGDALMPGTALIAPGGMQLELKSTGARKCIALRAKSTGELYSPCADITLASVARHFPGTALTIVMTGMGADGRDGAALMKRTGAPVWAQDEASCTIYGMPKAVADAGLADQIYTLDQIADGITRIN